MNDMKIKQALNDPTSVYKHPDEIYKDSSLTKHQKINILRRWEYDARELEVAEEEGMVGGPPDLLAHILTALHKLNVKIDMEHTPPTKQGVGN